MVDNNITTVKTVPTYLKWVHKQLRQGHIDVKYKDAFFRGQASRKWTLKPQVFRTGKNEFKLLQQAQMLAWNELSDCKSSLEKLVKFQHYGLCTRLLDVTMNPLVALYFASDTCSNDDGCVYWGETHAINNIEQASIIADIVFSLELQWPIDLERISQLTKAKGYTYSDDIIKNAISNPCFFYPPQNNARIIAQKGAFLIAPIINNNEEPINDFEFKDGNNNIFNNNIAVIKSGYKKKIREELSFYGVHRATLFPGIDSKMEYINQSVPNSQNFNIKPI